MSKLLSMLILAAASALLCGIIGGLIAGIRAIGTSVALPGLGLIVAGPLAAGFVGALTGAAVGFVLGLLIGVAILVVRQ